MAGGDGIAGGDGMAGAEGTVIAVSPPSVDGASDTVVETTVVSVEVSLVDSSDVVVEVSEPESAPPHAVSRRPVAARAANG
jgi:hypothetical protein